MVWGWWTFPGALSPATLPAPFQGAMTAEGGRMRVYPAIFEDSSRKLVRDRASETEAVTRRRRPSKTAIRMVRRLITFKEAGPNR
jgi:hypothetical protein